MQPALIIPLYKQNKYWSRMINAIESQSVMPKFVYVMMDRPSDKDYNEIVNQCSRPNLKTTYKVFNCQELPDYLGRPTQLPDFDLFLTGHRRNIAIEQAIADGCDMFVMIDGDCIPQEHLIKSHMKACDNHLPMLVCGRRCEEKHGGLDQRDLDQKVAIHKLFSSVNPHPIMDNSLHINCSVVWSCNISMNMKAIERIKKVNQYYFGRSEVFSSQFVGTWGGEDAFLGIEAYASMVVTVTINDAKSGILHIDHPRPESKYGSNSFFKYFGEQVELFNAMRLNKPIPMDILT